MKGRLLTMSNREFTNVYTGRDYAASYAALDWGGTYHLIYRALPGIIERHVTGNRALDFGCGAGRSTRLLRSYGFKVTGIDISEAMVSSARRLDPEGDYRVCSPAEFADRPPCGFDLVLAAFPFDNIPADEKIALFRAVRDLMTPAATSSTSSLRLKSIFTIGSRSQLDRKTSLLHFTLSQNRVPRSCVRQSSSTGSTEAREICWYRKPVQGRSERFAGKKTPLPASWPGPALSIGYRDGGES